jgi:methylmalonyl-CoA carboxyltransferase small subunit
VSGDESKLCRSPIAGVVVRVAAEVGKPVKAQDPLVVLEAMKMESSITAPRDGTPAVVHVKPGDAVKAGEVLVELS